MKRPGAAAPSLSQRLLQALLVPVVALSSLVAIAHWGAGQSFFGSPIAEIPAPALEMVSDSGVPFDWKSLRGSVTLLYFGYTHCPDVCPATLLHMQNIAAAFGRDFKRVKLVFVTFDPARDTPQMLHHYLSAFNPTPIGLTGTPSATRAGANAYGVQFEAVAGNAYFDHSSIVTLIDGKGRERLRYGFSQMGDIHAVAGDIAKILKESQG